MEYYSGSWRILLLLLFAGSERGGLRIFLWGVFLDWLQLKGVQMNTKGFTKEATRGIQQTMLKRQIGNLEAKRALLEQKLKTFEEPEFGGSVPRPDWSTSFQLSHYAGPIRVMTVREVSDYLHVHPGTIYKLLKHHQIPAFHVGSDWRFNIETIDSWRLDQGKLGG